MKVPLSLSSSASSSSSRSGGDSRTDAKADFWAIVSSFQTRDMHIIGNYVLGETIGKGTYGNVVLARHILTGQEVAVKIISKLYGPLVVHEVEAWRHMRHPNICQLYEVLCSETYIYLVMEYASYGELFDFIVQRGRLKEAQAKHVFRQLVDAIGYCHYKGFVHRDLKPENLLLDSNANLKVIDFGFACAHQPTKLLDTFCGSVTYVAPEIISKVKYSGEKSDIWSMGVILFALLCGRLPFDDEHDDERAIFQQIKEGSLQFEPGLSDAAKDLIESMLKVNPSERLSIESILDHEWLHSESANSVMWRGQTKRRSSIQFDSPQEQAVVAELAKMGIELAAIKNSVDKCYCDTISGLYFLIRRKLFALPSLDTSGGLMAAASAEGGKRTTTTMHLLKLEVPLSSSSMDGFVEDQPPQSPTSDKPNSRTPDFGRVRPSSNLNNISEEDPTAAEEKTDGDGPFRRRRLSTPGPPRSFHRNLSKGANSSPEMLKRSDAPSSRAISRERSQLSNVTIATPPNESTASTRSSNSAQDTTADDDEGSYPRPASCSSEHDIPAAAESNLAESGGRKLTRRPTWPNAIDEEEYDQTTTSASPPPSDALRTGMSLDSAAASLLLEKLKKSEVLLEEHLEPRNAAATAATVSSSSSAKKSTRAVKGVASAETKVFKKSSASSPALPIPSSSSSTTGSSGLAAGAALSTSSPSSPRMHSPTSPPSPRASPSTLMLSSSRRRSRSSVSSSAVRRRPKDVSDASDVTATAAMHRTRSTGATSDTKLTKPSKKSSSKSARVEVPVVRLDEAPDLPSTVQFTSASSSCAADAAVGASQSVVKPQTSPELGYLIPQSTSVSSIDSISAGSSSSTPDISKGNSIAHNHSRSFEDAPSSSSSSSSYSFVLNKPRSSAHSPRDLEVRSRSTSVPVKRDEPTSPTLLHPSSASNKSSSCSSPRDNNNNNNNGDDPSEKSGGGNSSEGGRSSPSGIMAYLPRVSLLSRFFASFDSSAVVQQPPPGDRHVPPPTTTAEGTSAEHFRPAVSDPVSVPSVPISALSGGIVGSIFSSSPQLPIKRPVISSLESSSSSSSSFASASSTAAASATQTTSAPNSTDSNNNNNTAEVTAAAPAASGKEAGRGRRKRTFSLDQFRGKVDGSPESKTREASTGLFGFRTTSNRSPDYLAEEVVRVLTKGSLFFQRDGYVFFVNSRDTRITTPPPLPPLPADVSAPEESERSSGGGGSSKTIRFRLEICRLPGLNLHGIRFKRLSGDTWQYKELCNHVIDQLHI